MIRAVVDLTDGPQGSALAELGDGLYDRVVSRAPPRVALVVTEAQREHLPHRFAESPEVRVVVARDARAGWKRVAELAEGGAVVVSSRRFSPLLHWVAAEGTLQGPTLTPADGVERWKKGLSLDDVPVAASLRDVSLLVDDVAPAEPPAELVAAPGRVRALLAALSYGREVAVRGERAWGAAATPADARARLAWGRALDVPVAATESEWGTLLLERAKALGAGVISLGDEVEVAAQRAKVARGATPSRAVLSGAQLHLVNPSAALRKGLGALPGVFVHDEAPRASGFDRVRALARETPWEAWLDDPYMDAALARIDPQGHDRDELEFARASLLVHDRLAPPPAPRRREWRALLAAMVARDPPAAALRVPVTVGAGASRAVILPHREVDRRASLRGKELVGVRALVPPRVTRDDAVVALEASTERVGGGEWNAWVAQRRFLLPTARVLDDAEALTDLFVRAPSRNALTPDLLRWWSQAADEHQLGLFWPSTPVPVAAGFWRSADRQLGMLWLALRRALASGLDASLADGTGLLEMGGGLVAEVAAFSRAPAHARADAEAEFVCSFEPDRDGATRSVDEAAIAHGVGARAALAGKARAELVTRVPRRLYLAQHDARVELTFHATPWEAHPDGAPRHDLDASLASVTTEWPSAAFEDE